MRHKVGLNARGSRPTLATLLPENWLQLVFGTVYDAGVERLAALSGSMSLSAPHAGGTAHTDATSPAAPQQQVTNL